MKGKRVLIPEQNRAILEDYEVDEKALAEDEIIVDTECTFISTGTELANYTGREPKVFQPGTWCAYPWVPGYASAGRVLAAGDRVRRVAVGDRVFSYARHSSPCLYKTDRLVVKVPDQIDSALAAASRMAAVAATAPLLSEIRPNAWVAVFGLGLVGNLAAQLYRLGGCRVIGVDPVATRRELARRCGLEHVVGGSEAEVQQAVEELTGGTKADIAVDAVGHSAVVMQALRATATLGQLVILGSPRVQVDGNLTEAFSDIHLRFITVRGALEWCFPMYADFTRRMSQEGKQKMLFDLLSRDVLKLRPLISHELPPSKIQEAYQGLLNEPESYTGVVLRWRQA
jgi:2-desacetyl-2-hydroxyethyl bacteriochlorophyllide A dehydrogenase